MDRLRIGNAVVERAGERFYLRHRSRLFPALSLDNDQVEQLVQFLVGATPPRLYRTRATRTPVALSSGLTTTLRVGGRTWVVWPVNISRTGIYVEFPAKGAPGLEAGAAVELGLRWGGCRLQMPGVIRHYNASGYGIYLPGADQAAAADDPGCSYVGIVTELERRWRRSHLDHDEAEPPGRLSGRLASLLRGGR